MDNKLFILNNFSKHLFWDTNISDIDINKNSKFIISKVLKYGMFSDWKNIVSYYGIQKIAETAKDIRDIDKKTASFLSVISNVNKTDFQCYSTKQSTVQHWNF